LLAEREILKAIFYILRGGVPWRMVLDCFSPRQTVYGWFGAFRDASGWETLNHHVVMLDRERASREASPGSAENGQAEAVEERLLPDLPLIHHDRSLRHQDH
jgi:putative transposase